MTDDDSDHYEGISGTEKERKELVSRLLRHSSEDEQFGILFPEIKREIDEKLKDRK